MATLSVKATSSSNRVEGIALSFFSHVLDGKIEVFGVESLVGDAFGFVPAFGLQNGEAPAV
jgi:hypothetical protein